MFIMSVFNVKIVWKVRTNLIKILSRIFWYVFLYFVFFNRFSRLILLFFSLACCFSCFVRVIIFNNFHTFCILQSGNYLLIFFMISKRKSNRISVNIHKNKIIFYLLVLTFFFQIVSIQVLMTSFFQIWNRHARHEKD